MDHGEPISRRVDANEVVGQPLSPDDSSSLGVMLRPHEGSPQADRTNQQLAEKILVIEDDRDIARFVEVNLRSAGYEVWVALDGEEGMRLADQVCPDLVVLDLMMPGISGFEVADRLRGDPRTAGTRILVLTAKSASADRALALASGADDYLVKPIDPGEFLARVETALHAGTSSMR